MRQAEDFAWAVPTVAIAAQASGLPVAFDHGESADAIRLLPADLRKFTDLVPEIKRATEKAIARCERVRGADAGACRP
ncbi:MAG: hypothetical protein R3C15_06585 [Thermoleophilia bacterium]